MAVDPEEAQDSIVLTQFSGLKNTVAPSRLALNEQAIARNLDIDDAFQPRRRRGYTRVATGDFHSLTTVGERTFAVRDGSLVRITTGYDCVVLQPDVGPARVAFVDIAGTTYFSSKLASGKILPDDTIRAWGMPASAREWHSPVVNPTATLPDLNGRLLSPPPLAEHLVAYNGRIWLADGSVVWMTELYLYDYVDRTRGFVQFESEVTGLLAVADGVYVGTADAVWFLTGALGTLQRTRMTPRGMVKHTAVDVPAEMLALDTPTYGRAGMFVSPSGICVGLASGVCYSLTHGTVELPAAAHGAVLGRQDAGTNFFISTLNSAGGPTSTARFGDYVDAEIRRFAGV